MTLPYPMMFRTETTRSGFCHRQRDRRILSWFAGFQKLSYAPLRFDCLLPSGNLPPERFLPYHQILEKDRELQFRQHFR